MKTGKGFDQGLDPPAKPSDAMVEKNRELTALVEMNREIHSTMHLHRLLQILVEKAVIGVNFERGLIYLIEDDYLRCVAFLDRVKEDRATLIAQKVGFRITEKSVEALSVKLGKSIYIENAVEDSRVSPKFLKFADVREYCVVPLIGREKVLGVFTGDKYYSGNAILPEDIKTLELFAGHISLAIENAKLYEQKEYFNRQLEEKVNKRTAELEAANRQLSSKMAELSALVSVSQLMNQSQRVGDIMDKILPIIHRLEQNPCLIHLTSGEGPICIFSSHFSDLQTQPQDIDLNPDLIARVRRTQKPFVMTDIGNISSSKVLMAFCSKNRFASGLIIPLYADEEKTATLIIYSRSAVFFNQNRQDFYSAFASQARVALERAFLFEKMVKEKNSIEKKSAHLERENIYLKDRIKSNFNDKLVIGNSSAMGKVVKAVNQVAGTEATVIIYGETGTGKELIAKSIHSLSSRNNSALITVNCAAIPEELLESELFGHHKGAFTGAHIKRIGMFELAHRGTIFLDEIGELSPNTQKKLLRVLQEQEFHPLGAKAPVKVDVRVLAATNKNLKAEMEAGNFRPDLYYRLNVFPIKLPPLRERQEDLPSLVDFFLSSYQPHQQGKLSLDPGVIAEFTNYPWPGNIRELKNIIERLTIIAAGSAITREHLPREFGEVIGQDQPLAPLKQAVAELKKDMVVKALAQANGKKAEAAKILGLAPSNLSRMLKDLDLS